MGITFGNIHVYKGDIEQVKAGLGNNHIVKQLSSDWVTILGYFINDESSNAALSLSKSIKEPVLHFYYFDDVEFMTELFQGGKDVTSIEKYVSLLDLDSAQAKRFRAILKCENLHTQVSMLEELFGVALYVDPRIFKDEPEEDFYRERDDKVYQEYLKEQKKQKIKNKTKAVLVQEIIKKDYIIHSDELFWEFYEHIGYIKKKDEETLKLNTSNTLYCLIKEKHSKEPDVGEFLGAYLYNDYVYIIDRLPGEKLIGEVYTKGTIYKADLEGNILSKIHLDCIRSSQLLFSKNDIFYFGETRTGSNDRVLNSLLKLDLDLNIIQSNDFSTEPNVAFQITMNESLGIIYGYGFWRGKNKTCAFNMDTLEYWEKDRDFRIYELSIEGSDGEYLLTWYGSSLYVIDADMNLISVHRLKGTIYCIHTVEKQVFIITASVKESSDGYSNTCNLRLYSLQAI